MSFEDLVEARAKRNIKEAAKEKKNKKKRMCSQEQEEEVPDADTPQPKIARLNKTPERAVPIEHVDETKVVEHAAFLEPGKAPVAQMW